MGAPESGMQAAEAPAAETLLGAFKTIDASERRKHESVLGYWLSIRGDKEFPPLHDLDPLELSDASGNSILLELISGGHDAEIRHIGEALRTDAKVERLIDAPNPSILSCIAKKLPIVAISRDFLAFEDEFSTAHGKTRCWVTLLPLSAGGAWVDYVYALATAETVPAEEGHAAKKAKPKEPAAEGIEEILEETAEEPEAVAPPEAEKPAGSPEPEAEPDETEPEMAEQPAEEVEQEDESAKAAAAPSPGKSVAGFSKLFDSLAGLSGFYGSQPVKLEPVLPAANSPSEEAADEEQVAAEATDRHIADEPAADEEPADQSAGQPAQAPEGTLHSKLAEVRTKADEARMAKLRANAALYEGLSAAYDFALDAEDAPEEYLKLVEAQGLKIQLRSPMKPVVKLAFDGMCDDSTIFQLEAVLAWALKEELPRGSLAQRLEEEGGIARVLNGGAKAA